MTPNTTIYMIAGFCVILAGIFGYILSLFIRSKQVNKQIRKESQQIDKQNVGSFFEIES